MKAKKLFSGLFLLLTLGLLCPGPGLADYLTERWTFGELPNYQLWGAKGSPAVGDDGTIYFGAEDGYFWGINPNGYPKKLEIRYHPFRNTPAIAPDGTIIVHNGPTLYFFHPVYYGMTTHASVGVDFQGAPAISKQGIAYIGSLGGKLHAFDAIWVTKLWEHSVDLPPGCTTAKFSNPVIDLHGTIYCLYEATAGAWDTGSQGSICRLYAIYPNNEQKAVREFDNRLNPDFSTAIGPDGTIYVVGDNRLYALDPDNLNSKWELALEGSPTGSPVIGEPFNPSEGHSILVPLDTGLIMVGPPGHKHWTFQPEPALVAATPAIGKGGMVYFAASTYAVAQLHLITYATSSEDETYLLDKVWMDGPTKSSPANLRIGNQNVVYICENRSLSAWNNNVGGVDPGLAHTSWPCDRGNLKRNGRVSVAFSALFSVTQLKVKLDGLYLGHYVVSLGSKLDSAKLSLEKEELISAGNKLNAFIQEVSALKGKKIMAREADNLIEDAQRIVSVLQ
jgi:outer membrane protein assembly factor BamB